MSGSYISWLKFIGKFIFLTCVFYTGYYAVVDILIDIIGFHFINPLIDKQELLVVTYTETMVFFSKVCMIVGMGSFITMFLLLLHNQLKK